VTFDQAVRLELLKTGLTVVVLLITWLLGQRILASWELRKKRQELDIGITRRFHELYGEFKDLWRMWRIIHLFSDPPDDPGARRALLQRACAAEGAVESILFKIANEKALKADDIVMLGLFRQAYQKLRESIRDGQAVRWTYRSPEYAVFNVLACEVVEIMARPARSAGLRSRGVRHGAQNLKLVSAYRASDWKDLIERVAGEMDERKGEIPLEQILDAVEAISNERAAKIAQSIA